MSNGPATALLPDARFTRRNGERRSASRRGRDRTWQRFDPLFAATLVNHIMAPEATQTDGYAQKKPAPRCGIVVNVEA